jgi:hypothetical protein
MGVQYVDTRPEACLTGNFMETISSFSKLNEQISSCDTWPRARHDFTTLKKNSTYKANRNTKFSIYKEKFKQTAKPVKVIASGFSLLQSKVRS